MEVGLINTLVCTVLTIGAYTIGYLFFQKTKRGWLHPLLTVTLFIVGLLLLFHIKLESYSSGTRIFSDLLGIATVSLAIPLYLHAKTIWKNLSIVMYSIILGSLAGILSVVLLAKWLHFGKEILASLIPKSVTVPIAITVSDQLGGNPSLTTVFVLFSAITSLLLGPGIMKIIGIKSRLAMGLAMGATAQALGAARASDWGEKEGAMGSIAMSTSALFMSLLSPVIVSWVLY